MGDNKIEVWDRPFVSFLANNYFSKFGCEGLIRNDNGTPQETVGYRKPWSISSKRDFHIISLIDKAFRIMIYVNELEFSELNHMQGKSLFLVYLTVYNEKVSLFISKSNVDSLRCWIDETNCDISSILLFCLL